MPAGDILDERDAAHLLRRAGFGAAQRDLARFAGLTRAEAVDELLAVKPSAARGPGSYQANHAALELLQAWWLRRMLSSRYRLQEKMVLFWHDHMPSSYGVVGRLDALAEQNALFRLHALGSFRLLVEQVTRDRAMLEYLDGRRNRVGEVNENYARELMELFTLGPVDEDGNPNYTQQDVVMLARSLTGFYYDHSKKPTVALHPSRFDAGSKLLFATRPFQRLGVLGVQDFDGTSLPPETNVIDALFAHRDSRGRPTLARFLVRKLWAWFATPEADAALVDELSTLFVASDYQIGPLLSALLSHDAFYAEEARASTPKNPVEFVTQAMLALGVKSNLRELPRLLSRMGMDLFDPPGVEGWQHGPAWLATSRYLARLELAQALASGRGKNGFSFKPKPPVAATPESLVDAALARLGLEVSGATRQRAIDYLSVGSWAFMFSVFGGGYALAWFMRREWR
jgi:uncharacterized protein (DUF1800 family)